jgi:hypothetical protein
LIDMNSTVPPRQIDIRTARLSLNILVYNNIWPVWAAIMERRTGRDWVRALGPTQQCSRTNKEHYPDSDFPGQVENAVGARARQRERHASPP